MSYFAASYFVSLSKPLKGSWLLWRRAVASRMSGHLLDIKTLINIMTAKVGDSELSKY